MGEVFGLSGVDLNQIQEARAFLEEDKKENESEVVVEESVTPPKNEINEEMPSVLTNNEFGRCYMTIVVNPEDAIILVKNIETDEAIEKNDLGVYDVAEGSYSIDIAADGYENISTSVIVSSFDINIGYIQIRMDLDKLEVASVPEPLSEEPVEVDGEVIIESVENTDEEIKEESKSESI